MGLSSDNVLTHGMEDRCPSPPLHLLHLKISAIRIISSASRWVDVIELIEQ